jgi:hypothetical protein
MGTIDNAAARIRRRSALPLRPERGWSNSAWSLVLLPIGRRSSRAMFSWLASGAHATMAGVTAASAAAPSKSSLRVISGI